MIDMKDVRFDYDGVTVLEHLNVHIDDGEFVAIVGANGAGKSTFSKLLNGLNKPSAGSVVVNGLDTRKSRVSSLAKQCGFLFQNPDRQLCRDDVESELAFGLRQTGANEDLISERVGEMMAEFGFVPHMNPLTASRGEKQRVALAGLLALRPPLLVLDEPTTGLDYRECMHIMEIAQKLNSERGTTIVMVSHDMELVQDFAQRLLVLGEHSILADGPVDAVMSDESLLARASLLPCQITQLCSRLGNDFYGISSYMELVDKIERLRAARSDDR